MSSERGKKTTFKENLSKIFFSSTLQKELIDRFNRGNKNDPEHGDNCNDLYTACKKCYTEFREWQLNKK